MNISSIPQDCFIKATSFLSFKDLLTLASTSISLMQRVNDELENCRKKLSQATQTRTSAFDRLQCLFQALHVEYSSRPLVYELMQEIRNYTTTSNETLENVNFEQVFDAFQRVVKAHKLHAQLISSVIDNDLSTATDNEYRLQVPILKFMGDILICYHCFYLVEQGMFQGVNDMRWLDKIHHLLEKFFHSSWEWYHIYIFYYSFLLRMKVKRAEDCRTLGLLSDAMVQTDTCLEIPIYKHPLVQDLMSAICFKSGGECLLHLTILSFGPLGPAFRGRDDTEYVPFNDTILEISELNGDTWPEESLKRLYRESKKIQPMNVNHSSITFDLYE
ncbi:predicted protein [Chaetoceros tenuissimus]|uniref:F-box domain-containing protein n=1 Tax=Chaetoceros tenuissimus TaxID=426638 RepID=A0AAD3CV25_9STRA|nr:predicted protein [Chaetoceros tenuissimus]